MARNKPTGGSQDVTARAPFGQHGGGAGETRSKGVTHVVMSGVYMRGEGKVTANAEVVAAGQTETDVFDAWFAEIDAKLDDLDRRQDAFFRKMGADTHLRNASHKVPLDAEFEN